MKNIKRTLFSIVTSASLFMGYACKLETTNKKEPLLAQAIQPKVEKDNKQYVKIALLLDTSNSMDGLMNQAKAQLWDIVNEFTYAKCGNESRPELQIALYEYGNDDLSSREGHIRQVLGFSKDLDEISEKLFSLTTNGGEEFCGQVINTSLRQLDWGKNADDLKLIFIAGNEPFTQGKLDYRDATAQAKENDVVVNTIFCGNFDQGINTNWKDGAQRTGGDYMAIDHNQEIAYVATPYDDAIMKLNQKLNGTYIAYGSIGQSKLAAQTMQDSNAFEMEEAVAVKRAVSKSSRLYKNSTWDLVDAAEEDSEVIEQLKEDELPEVLKGKSKKEIKEFIATKKAERMKVQEEIQSLNTKREVFIAEQQQNQKGELENAMIKAIRKQAERRNYSWE
ncbi:vWA domain-containing protein [Croceivirga thetidis]|uniref:VWA domain-containing protein n=1 Tax=Croceivirga thetidis TaxID=2721623 RepID=A0ABX1GNQ6_9FLAO|nr:vWA domain-containing protein [Croceivirga thetidis]NKI30600.1 VWA domain-containing protein [Croceivirga thetidis]